MILSKSITLIQHANFKLTKDLEIKNLRNQSFTYPIKEQMQLISNILINASSLKPFIILTNSMTARIFHTKTNFTD